MQNSNDGIRREAERRLRAKDRWEDWAWVAERTGHSRTNVRRWLLGETKRIPHPFAAALEEAGLLPQKSDGEAGLRLDAIRHIAEGSVPADYLKALIGAATERGEAAGAGQRGRSATDARQRDPGRRAPRKKRGSGGQGAQE